MTCSFNYSNRSIGSVRGTSNCQGFALIGTVGSTAAMASWEAGH